MNKRKVGSEKETIAAKYLQAKGCMLLAQNYRCRLGEIDLIVKDGRAVVFVEVKFRKPGSLYDPVAAVDYKKQRRISRVALFYLTERRLPENTPCRFDVIGIHGDEIRHIPNAFPYLP